MALNWLYSFDFMNEIVLSGDVNNKKAINLYTKVGFKGKYQLCYFEKSVNIAKGERLASENQ